MSRHATIDLPDGRPLRFEIRVSARARSLRLKLSAWDGLTVGVPKGLSDQQVVDFVYRKRDWIAAKLARFEEAGHLLGERETALPDAFDLPALEESWQVAYRQTKAGTVGARTGNQGRVLVYGAVSETERCAAALRRWLARRAGETLPPWLASLSVQYGLRFSRVVIRNQRTRWGSCSAGGVISLNAKLLFLAPEQVRHVLMHELCHTVEPNHTPRFWAYLRHLEPRTDRVRGYIRYAWKRIPAWAHPVRA
jgi:predicted metal-dependent hydrolase